MSGRLGRVGGRMNASSAARFALWRALGLFLAAYVLVTVLAAGVTVAYGELTGAPQANELGVGLLEAPAFTATVPYHVLIMLVVWPLFAGLYFWGRRSGPEEERRETAPLSFLWLAAALIADFVGFVHIKHPWSLTPQEFYVDYQPWISLIYVAIFVSPWIRLGLVRTLSRS